MLSAKSASRKSELEGSIIFSKAETKRGCKASASLITDNCLLHRRLNGLLLARLYLGRIRRRLQIALPVHPLVEARALEAPPVAQLERGHKTFRRVFIKSVGRDAKVIGGLANIHDLAHFRNEQVRAGRGATHKLTPRCERCIRTGFRRIYR